MAGFAIICSQFKDSNDASKRFVGSPAALVTPASMGQDRVHGQFGALVTPLLMASLGFCSGHLRPQ